MSAFRDDHHRVVLKQLVDCVDNPRATETDHRGCCESCQGLQERQGDDYDDRDDETVREQARMVVAAYVREHGATQPVCTGAGRALADAIAQAEAEGCGSALEEDDMDGDGTLVERVLDSLPHGFARRWFCSGLVYNGVAYLVSSLEGMYAAVGYLPEQHARMIEYTLVHPYDLEYSLVSLVRTYLKMRPGAAELNTQAVAAIVDGRLLNGTYASTWANEDRVDVLLWKLLVSQSGDGAKIRVDAMRAASEKHANGGEVRDDEAWLRLVKEVLD